MKLLTRKREQNTFSKHNKFPKQLWQYVKRIEYNNISSVKSLQYTAPLIYSIYFCIFYLSKLKIYINIIVLDVFHRGVSSNKLLDVSLALAEV